MKQIIYILFMFFAFIACDETKVGYLEVDEASYDPNTMIVQKNPDEEEEADRIERKYPWGVFANTGDIGNLSDSL